MILRTTHPTDAVVVASIDRGRANALDLDLVEQLRVAVASIGHDQALVIAGAGDMFCAGLDNEIIAAGGRAADDLLDSMGTLLVEILESSRPVVVAAAGHGIAAGAMLMLCADYAVVSDGDARYGFAEVSMGLPLPAPVVALIAERMQPAMRLRVAAHGELLDGGCAVMAGMADEMLPTSEVELSAVEHARRLAALPSESYEQTKRLVNGMVVERMGQSSK